MQSSLRVNLGQRSYDIVVASDSLNSLGAFARHAAARTKGSSALFVTDEHAQVHAQPIQQSLVANGFRTTLAIRPAGEGAEVLDVAAQLYDALVDLPADRRTLVVAVGGGVIGDLAGFVAATYQPRPAAGHGADDAAGDGR